MSRSNRIYIGRLSHQAREKDVERFFRGFGRIRDINLKNGFGFVEFDDYRDAEDAVYELHGRELLGERVIVEHARGNRDREEGGGGRGGGGGDYRDYRRSGGGRDFRQNDRGRNDRSYSGKYGPPLRTDFRILVENISSRVSWQDLKDFMRSAGEITYADAHKQRQGEGIVEYATYDDMKNAMKKLQGTDLNGRRIKLVEDYRGSKRSHSRSRSGSRSRSHSRSRSPSKERSRSRSNDRSKDGSPNDRDHSPSANKSHDDENNDRRSGSPDVKNGDDDERRSRSRSGSPRDNNHSRGDDDEEEERDRNRSRSPRSRSPRSKSDSPRRRDDESKERSRSPSPIVDEETED